MNAINIDASRHLHSLKIELEAVSTAAAHPNRVAWAMRLRALAEIADSLDAEQLITLAARISKGG